MRVVRHLAAAGASRRPVVLTLGNFDGVHLGHRAILERVCAEARAEDADAVVFTFFPHPAAVLAPGREPRGLQTLRDRLATLRAVGIDRTIVQRFTDRFASIEAEEFVETCLLAHFDVRHVVVGHRVSFGRARRGTSDMLHALGERHGFTVDCVGPISIDDLDVSSTAARRAIEAGELETVATLLGRPWAVRGRVGEGERRGRTIGFPTANVHLRTGMCRPPDGVYAARVRIAGTTHSAVLNLGRRPTFGLGERTLEVHVLDYDGDLYGQWLVVEFVAWLRGEQAFAGLAELEAAIATDVAAARVRLADAGTGNG